MIRAAQGGKQGPLVLTGVFDEGQRSRWLEQQDDWPQPPDGVAMVNPMLGDCWWAVDEHSWDFRRIGYLDPGMSVSEQVCVVSDFSPVHATRYGTTALWSMAPYGFVGAKVMADTADVTVEVCYQPQNRCFVGNPVWDAAFGRYAASVCSRVSYRTDDPALQDIPGSNGGRGVITTATLTVRNTSTRRAKNVDARGGYSSDVFFPPGCPGPVQTQNEYPFQWTTS